MPPSISVSLPPIPKQIDVDPEPVGQLADGSMGTLTADSVRQTERYGILAVRFNALRELYSCLRATINEGRPLDTCTNAPEGAR